VRSGILGVEQLMRRLRILKMIVSGFEILLDVRERVGQMVVELYRMYQIDGSGFYFIVKQVQGRG